MSSPSTAQPVPMAGEHEHLRVIARTDVGRSAPAAWRPVRALVESAAAQLEAVAMRWLVAHSIVLLRLSLGAVFLGFGALKLFPGVSPAEDLVRETTRILSFGLVPGPLAVAGVGALECVIGACLLTGRALRCAICLLATLLVGILAPLLVLAPRLFSGPHHMPTLEGQYVLKDLILVAATFVLAATIGGAALRAGERSPTD